MVKVVLYVVAFWLAAVSWRFASKTFLDFGEIPLNLTVGLALISLLFALLCVKVATGAYRVGLGDRSN